MHGSAEFWSSGGLLQWVDGDEPVLTYEFNSLTPKHITVIPFGGRCVGYPSGPLVCDTGWHGHKPDRTDTLGLA